jgi:transposase-like protein
MEIVSDQPIKEKKPTGRTPNYTPSYYLMMAKDVVENGMSYREASAKYKCSHGTVSHWSRLLRDGSLPRRIDRESKQKSKTDAQLIRQERYIKELKMEIGELYLENQLLKKARSHFQKIKSVDTSIITSENLDQYQEDVD